MSFVQFRDGKGVCLWLLSDYVPELVEFCVIVSSESLKQACSTASQSE